MRAPIQGHLITDATGWLSNRQRMEAGEIKGLPEKFPVPSVPHDVGSFNLHA